MDQLISLNVSPVIKEMQRNFAELDFLRISWFGRVQALKMKILPRFIFVFHTLILLIPMKMLIDPIDIHKSYMGR